MGEQEEWRPVVGHPRYEVSSLGRVLSRHRGGARILKPWVNVQNQYLYVVLCTDRVKDKRTVHSLVAEAFCGPRGEGQVVRHLDGSRNNNAASNLALGSSSENSFDAVRHGTHPMVGRTHCPHGHPYSADNTRMYQGRRFCRTCPRERYQRSILAAANVPDVAA